MKHLIHTILIICLFSVAKSFGQSKIYSDPSLRRKLNQAIDDIYGLNFEKSTAKIQEIERELGEHPAVYLIKAFEVYWKKKPFKAGTPEFKEFEGMLLESLRLSNKILEDDDENLEASFFALAAHAYLAQLYVDNNEKLKALGEAKSAYNYIVLGFDWVDQYPEYYFPCGIYNYYREKYPEENPFFKTFVWFFRSGDKKEGIEMLKKGADKSIFTKVENLNYLFHIYLRYENQPEKALPYAKKLYRMYSKNLTFLSHYVENLISNNSFAEARPLIDSLLASESNYHIYVGNVFYGIYLEKYAKDADAAMAIYRVAEQSGAQVDMRSPHIDSHLYLGMGRAYLMKGDQKKAETYFKLAYKTAEYSGVKNEASALLERL